MNDSLDKILERIYSTSIEAIEDKRFNIYEENLDLLLDLFTQSIKQSSNVKNSAIIKKIKKSIMTIINVLIKNEEMAECKNYLNNLLVQSNEAGCIEIVIHEILLSIKEMIEQGTLKLAKDVLKKVFEVNNGRKFLDNTGINIILQKYIKQIEMARTIKEINDMQVEELLELVISNLKPTEVQDSPIYNHDLVILYRLYMYKVLENKYIEGSKTRYILKIVKRIMYSIKFTNLDSRKKELTKVLCYMIKDNLHIIKNPENAEKTTNYKRIDLVKKIIKEITNSERYYNSKYTEDIVILSIFIYLYYLANEEENVAKEDQDKYIKILDELGTYYRRTLASYINIEIDDIWKYYEDVLGIINNWDYFGESQSKWIILPELMFELFLIMSSVKRELKIDIINNRFEDSIIEDNIFRFFNTYYSDHFDENLVSKFKKINKMMTNSDTYKYEIELLECETIKFYKTELLSRQNIDESELNCISNKLSKQITDGLNKEIVCKNNNLNTQEENITLRSSKVLTEFFRGENLHIDFFKNNYLENIYNILANELSKLSKVEEIKKWIDEKPNKNIYDVIRSKLEDYADVNLYIGKDLNNVNRYFFNPDALLQYHKGLEKTTYLKNYNTLIYLDINKVYLDINYIEMNIRKLSQKEVEKELKNFKDGSQYKIPVVNNIILPFEFEEAYQYIENENLKIEGTINIIINKPTKNGVRFNIKK